MKSNKGVISGLLGIALLAMPITAAARTHKDDHRFNRGVASVDRHFQSFRGAPMPQSNQRAIWNRPILTPVPMRAMPLRDRDDNYPRAHNDNYYNGSYGPNYYPPQYAPEQYAPMAGGQYYGAPGMGGGTLANLIRARDNAQYLYAQAVRRGDRVGAKHLNNAIQSLQRRIASMSGGGRYAYESPGAPAYSGLGGLGAYTNQYPNNQYGYGNGSGIDSLLPLLGNYIH